jgi:hypothetical protein
MPTWAKVLLSIAAAGFLLLIVGGVAVVKFYKSQVEATERAAAEGRGYGLTVSIDRCTSEGVRRSGACKGITCAMHVHSFMWGCLENATYDADYCASVAPVENNAATARWAAKTCAEHGQPEDETCQFVMTVVPSYCSYVESS